VRLSDDLLDEPANKQREVLVHELLHCHFDDAYFFARNHVEGGEPAKDALMRFFEKGIDGLADAIAPMMPLPGPYAGGEPKGPGANGIAHAVLAGSPARLD
jgi:hypothetical protein